MWRRNEKQRVIRQQRKISGEKAINNQAAKRRRNDIKLSAAKRKSNNGNI